MQLRPVTYYRIGVEDKKEIGLIAEEVSEIYPELIKYDESGQVDGINYTRIAPILIKTIQEQQELIKNLTKRIDDLENR
jgi:chaperonin cofactor prefoldin